MNVCQTFAGHFIDDTLGFHFGNFFWTVFGLPFCFFWTVFGFPLWEPLLLENFWASILGTFFGQFLGFHFGTTVRFHFGNHFLGKFLGFHFGNHFFGKVCYTNSHKSVESR